jgi:hypothetical protein
MNSHPQKTPPLLTITINHPGTGKSELKLPVPTKPPRPNTYFASHEGKHRVVLLTPGWRGEGKAQIPDPQIHGLDFDTAARLLAEIALAILRIEPTNQNPST